MNEKDLNIEYICEKTLLSKDDKLVPIILDLIQDSYKAGLCQSEFDNTMNLIEEIQELKKQLEDKCDFINKLQAVKNKLNKWDYENTMKQQKFIKYLEDEIEQNTPNVRWKHYNEDYFNDYDVENPICIEIKPTNKVLKEVLQKYKKIVNGSERRRKRK